MFSQVPVGAFAKLDRSGRTRFVCLFVLFRHRLPAREIGRPSARLGNAFETLT